MLKLNRNKPPWNVVQDVSVQDCILKIKVYEKFKPAGPYPCDGIRPSDYSSKPRKAQLVLIDHNQVKVEPGYTTEMFFREQIDTYKHDVKEYYGRARSTLSGISFFVGMGVSAVVTGIIAGGNALLTATFVMIAVDGATFVGLKNKEKIRAWLRARKMVKWAEERYKEATSKHE